MDSAVEVSSRDDRMFRRDDQRFDAVARFAEVVDQERERIVRLWGKRLERELQEVEVAGSGVRAPLEPLIAELARMLKDRGEEAIWLWPEVLRSHAIRRFELRFDVTDIARELKALQGVLLRVYARKNAGIEPEVAELIAEITGEAAAAAHAAYARVLRTEEVRFREASLMESVLHHVDVGILLAGADGGLSYATPPVTRLLGLPVRQLVGRPADALATLLTQLRARHPSGQPFRAAEMPFARALAEKRAVLGVRMAIDRFPDLHEVVLEMSATPLFEEGRVEPYGAIQTITDRTETDQKERELQTLARRAADTVHALNNSLNVLKLRTRLLEKEFKREHLVELSRVVTSVTDQVAALSGPTASATVPAPSPKPARPRGMRRVLVVDDDLENARILAEVLTEEGYAVQTAHDPRLVLERWEPDRFDAALIDARMPEMTGWELAREIRHRSPLCSVAIVTGDDLRGASKANLAAVDAVFRKPVDVGALDEFLSQAPS